MKVSFETPEYTANADGIGTLRILEAMRILGLEKKTRFYQASTSELYGEVLETPQNENTPLTHEAPMRSLKCMPFTSPKITERLITCLRLMAFFLIMKVG